LIDSDTVIHRGQLTGLYIVDSKNIVHFRLLRLGKTFGDSIEVLSGLKEGDRYVKTPSPKISDGARVEVAR
ncbi:MAG: efflux RND transporter periplasmic adaptor subunit, partial [Deltaproteobacteria bacterium]|nr:efflux RND transporter periplasmic adaptor subunit [Deltaproteobacteria bacterium]